VKDLDDPESQSPLANAPNAELSIPEWARRLARLLDSAIRIPGTDLSFGLDPILGALLPELGDALSGVLSLALLTVAFRERVPKVVFARMLLNIGIDAILGAFPVVGDLFDFAFKANEKNLALIERYRGDPTRGATWGDHLVLGAAFALAFALVLIPIVVGVALVRALWTLLSSPP
jgi:hypothetical protein